MIEWLINLGEKSVQRHVVWAVAIIRAQRDASLLTTVLLGYSVFIFKMYLSIKTFV